MRHTQPAAGLTALWTALAALTFGMASASAQPVAEFYKSRTLTLVVSVPPGGGYDVLARAVGRHIGRNVPGGPNVVVQNTCLSL